MVKLICLFFVIVMLEDHETTFKIALTGIVLVKEQFAIGNADDIAKIPKRIFKEDAQAMFIPSSAEPWFCRLVDYMTHPEYELDTLNSVAVVELAEPKDGDYPMKPACWLPSSYNIESNLYAVGYTDENQLLEKFIHKLQYVQKDMCKEFYNRAGLTEGMRAPMHYECGFAAKNNDSCVWDNGMALVSNSSGPWVLIGLGIQGPGCSAPARFISLPHYFQWIESATIFVDMDEEARRSAFNEGFKKSYKDEVEYVPAHELLRQNQNDTNEKIDKSYYYPYDVLIHHDDPFHIERINGTEILIDMTAVTKKDPYAQSSYGNCSDSNIKLIYRDTMTVQAPGKEGSVQYLMTLHDPRYSNYTCVTIRVLAKEADSAYLYYDTILHDGTILPEAPEDIIRVYPFYNQSRLITKEDYINTNTTSYIKSEVKNITAYNVNLYLKVVFKDKCELEIVYYGPEGDEPDVVETTTPDARFRRAIDDILPEKFAHITNEELNSNMRKYIPLDEDKYVDRK